MSTVIEAKQQHIDVITEQLKNSVSTVLVDYRGLTVAEMTELRKQLREANIEFKVYKNTMTRRAAEKAELTEINEFLNKEMYNVVLSLDGRKEIHARLRRTVNGKGSYDYILPKFQKFVEGRGDKEYYVRGTYTGNNVDFTNDIFHVANLGFDKLSMEPVICDPSEPYALTEKHLPALYRQYEILAEEMLKRGEEGNDFTFYHYMLDLSEGPCIQKRISGCGSGTEYMAVTPWGELFPCHQFVGDEEFSLGNIWDGVTKPELQSQFKEVNCYSKPECQDCWAKLYCSGGCPANSLHATGSLKGNYEFSCDLFRKRVECSMMVKVAESIREMEAEAMAAE